QARAVAALAVGVEAAPVGEARERPHPELDRLVAELGRGDKTHAASGSAGGQLPPPGTARGIHSGGTDLQATGNRRIGLVRYLQTKRENVMRSSHSPGGSEPGA